MKKNKRRFSCSPEEKNQIFIPDCDAKRIPSPKLPSPTTCLPDEELEELERSIDKANEILLSLGTPEEEDRNQAFFDSLRRFKAAKVTIDITCPEPIKVEGCLEAAGRDFLLLSCSTSGGFRIIPFEHINKIKIKSKRHVKNERELLDIDPRLRRKLVLNFGATVSRSPFLINEFFGLTLPIMLLLFRKKVITAILPDDQVEGVLARVDNETVCIVNGEKRTVVPILNACGFLIE
ncbi:hypothetical protein JOC77_002496 [Peribacillus deserti]|uniref:Uncharacterized protein n=1 Tax=Peribacillus deserti TaxID=673318 RepID=A0ABS2QIZ2_9BACI|nr:hypothetical protein [Peribacillus deserti]MBM7693057.1 hypothetical protein [Peribacillus deserti]